MITAILIDDEVNALEVLEWQIRKFCQGLEIAAICSSADDGIEAIRRHNPDLVFLDIEMPIKNGFDVLNAFDDPKFDVIFTTAYNEFAVKAFKYSAFDYLLKPIDTSELQAAIERYKSKKQHSIKEQLKILTDQYTPHSSGRIAVNSPDGLIMLKPEQVVRCQAISNYTKVFLADGQKVLVTKTLKEVEETLHGYSFYRIHSSHLINVEHVQRYVKQDGGYVVMSDGEQLAVARNRKDGFMELFARI